MPVRIEVPAVSRREIAGCVAAGIGFIVAGPIFVALFYWVVL